ncbi:TRAP transporter substrate-binding protein [Kaistia adipata]|uniref:TRAP transporter substrate-binding protein n=1 Tax=Kaistia adipata TaxID=166954 RepID=UPI000403FBEF|nr:ABC transporter substrate-binding protein [Kaistia adipata]
MSADHLDRRGFIRTAGLGSGVALAGTTLSVPARAEAGARPVVKWRLQSDFPRSVGPLYSGAETLALIVAGLTDGQFQIEVQPAESKAFEPVRTLDAVRSGRLEACHTSAYYHVAENPAFAFGSALPFGLNARMQNAWIIEGGGRHLLDSFHAGLGLVAFVAGNSGAQMGGWFRKEIRSVTEIAGMKMRIAGLGAPVMERLGVETLSLSGQAAFEALEIGTIDAAEFAGPAADEPLGFYKVAPYYYYPGWWDGGASIHLFANQATFEALPPSYQAVLKAAAAQVNDVMLARMDIANNAAIRRLVANGAQLRPFPNDLLEAAYKAAFQLYAELSASHPDFKAIYEPWKAFRDQIYQWYRVAEFSFDSFGFNQQARGL